MNTLSVSLQHSIITLATNGWSQRRIARELGIHRETVGRHLRREDSKPAKVPTGSAAQSESKPAILPAGSEPKPAKVPPGILLRSRSQCELWRDWIEQGVWAGLTAQRIYQDLVGEHQYVGSYDAVKRFVRRLRKVQPEAFMRIEVAPGIEAQVDFGLGAWVWGSRGGANDRICSGLC